MKKYVSLSKLFLLLTFVSTSVFLSCNEDGNCNDTVCTLELVGITATIEDQNKTPFVLDSLKVINKLSGEKFTTHLTSAELQQAFQNGRYPIITDLEIGQNETLELQLLGFKNGQEIVNEDYIVAADCCHVSLVSGELELVINQ